MKIFYTYNGLDGYKINGVIRYYYEIIDRIKNTYDIYIGTKFSNSEYVSHLAPTANAFLPKYSFRGKSRIETFLQNKYSYSRLQKESYDIIHHTGEEPNVFKYNKGKPVVITIHDMIPEIYIMNKVRIKNREICINSAQHIVCVSQNTKNDLLHIYPHLDPNKISVIYHGENTCDYINTPNFLGKYILYVGTRREQYKNFLRFIQAMQPIIVYNDEISVVCTGNSFTKQEILFFKKIGIENKIINTGFVDDQTLFSLYQHALCFVYPSKYEGFGIPILEAFKNNCPVCLSDASCFPEIAGDAAIFFNADDFNSITNAVLSVLKNDNLRNDLIKKGQNRLSLYSWDKAAQQTINVYESIKY